MNAKQVLEFAKKSNVVMVDLKFTDFPGQWQHFSVPLHELEESSFEDGFGFDGSSIRGWQAIHNSDLLVIPGELRARRGDKVIELSLRDVSLLELFYRHRSQVLDRGTIFNRCWGQDYLPNSRTLDQHISQLRKRIEADASSPRIIRTVHNAGYRYDG